MFSSITTKQNLSPSENAVKNLLSGLLTGLIGQLTKQLEEQKKEKEHQNHNTEIENLKNEIQQLKKEGSASPTPTAPAPSVSFHVAMTGNSTVSSTASSPVDKSNSTTIHGNVNVDKESTFALTSGNNNQANIGNKNELSPKNKERT